MSDNEKAAYVRETLYAIRRLAERAFDVSGGREPSENDANESRERAGLAADAADDGASRWLKGLPHDEREAVSGFEPGTQNHGERSGLVSAESLLQALRIQALENDVAQLKQEALADRMEIDYWRKRAGDLGDSADDFSIEID